jgi:excisionase family DNA binding protein
MKTGKLLTTKELADYLGTHPVSINRKVAKGELPFYRLSKTDLRFDLEEVLKSLKGNEE